VGFSESGVVSPEIKPTSLTDKAESSADEQNKFSKIANTTATGLTVVATACWSSPKSTTGRCMPWTLAAVGAYGVATHNSDKANQNLDIANLYRGNFRDSNSQTGADSNSSDEVRSQLSSTLSSLNNMAEKAKLKIDHKKGTVKTADGKTFSVKDISSAQSMQLAGLDPKSLEEIKNEIKKNEQKAIQSLSEKKINSEDDSIEVNTGAVTGGEKPPDFNFSIPRDREKLVGRDPADVTGLTKNYNGELIGVSGDSLFDIIDRRYQLHNQNGSFLYGK
jgi:hypothetical protein